MIFYSILDSDVNLETINAWEYFYSGDYWQFEWNHSESSDDETDSSSQKIIMIIK